MKSKDPLKVCVRIFKKYNIKTQKELIKFTKKNHPDHADFEKKSQQEKDDIITLLECFGDRKNVLENIDMETASSKPVSGKLHPFYADPDYGKPPSSWGMDSNTKSTSKSTLTQSPLKTPIFEFESVDSQDQSQSGLRSIQPDGIKFPDVKKERYTKKAYECIRKHSNFSYIARNHRFDKASFAPNVLKEAIPVVAPKINAILKKIEELDKKDMKAEGKKFKHFIFSDVKEGGYGAKILASCFIANDYNIAITDKLQLNTNMPKSDKNFAVLSSTALYNKPFSDKLKKKILSVYNERPENTHGEKMRFIILDSGFKEGIDLFDVKYVHLLEPPLNTADLKQAVGRATRTCGQKGLVFVPGKGIKLEVFTYDLDLSNLRSSKYDTMYQTLLAHSQIDLSLLKFTEELNKVAINSAIDMELTHNINSFSNKAEQKGLLALRDMRKDNTSQQKGGMIKTNIIFECANAELCGKRSTKKVPFNNTEMEITYRSLGYSMPSIESLKKQDIKKRAFFCGEILRLSKFCTALKQLQLNPALLEQYMKQIKEQRKSRKTKQKTPNDNQLVVYKPGLAKKTPDGAIIPYLSSKTDNSIMYDKKLLQLEDEKEETDNVMLLNKYVSRKRSSKKGPKTRKRTWSKFSNMKEARKFIRKNFSKFKWEKPVVTDECNVQKGGAKKKKYTLINYHETQDFVRHYFTPYSPYKGLLLWHSVGTGKTCAAVATATTTYEKMGYTIIFVTRTTLKNDIWKNVFKMVCSDTIRDKIAEGLEPTGNFSKDKRKLLSKLWVEPMSYKQFSNAMAGKNKYYTDLVKRNGSKDPLRKTLLIIDEAHKLYGGDLKGAEKPDISSIEKMIFNSYQRSKLNSVKLLLMTATPITNDAMELINLLNLMTYPANERFPAKYTDFAQKYLNNEGSFLNLEKKKEFMDKISPYISYLSREADPRKFAIPEYSNVNVKVDTSRIFKRLEDMPEFIDAKERRDDRLSNANDKLAEANNNAERELEEKLEQIEATFEEGMANTSPPEPLRGLKGEHKEEVRARNADKRATIRELKAEKRAGIRVAKKERTADKRQNKKEFQKEKKAAKKEFTQAKKKQRKIFKFEQKQGNVLNILQSKKCGITLTSKIPDEAKKNAREQFSNIKKQKKSDLDKKHQNKRKTRKSHGSLRSISKYSTSNKRRKQIIAGDISIIEHEIVRANRGLLRLEKMNSNKKSPSYQKTRKIYEDRIENLNRILRDILVKEDMVELYERKKRGDAPISYSN